MVRTDVLYFNRIKIVYDEYSVCDESSNQTPILFGKFESGKHRWCDTLNIMKTARKKVNQYIKKVPAICFSTQEMFKKTWFSILSFYQHFKAFFTL